VWSSGGLDNCAFHDIPVTSIGSCFNGYTFLDNAIIGAPANDPPSRWPAGNLFPATPADVMFVNYHNGNGGDYHLAPQSPYRQAATDGKDLGADIDAVNAAIAGVK